jgi:hypothetical protein
MILDAIPTYHVAYPTSNRQTIMNPSVPHSGRCRHHLPRQRHLLHLFRPDAETGKPEADPNMAPQEESQDAVICRQCHHEISASSERQTVNGAHVHSFANPEGIIFEIACFGDAWGCGYVGPASTEFTWFSGYQWRIAVCASCHTHLGWRFDAVGGHCFHGLITSKILSADG